MPQHLPDFWQKRANKAYHQGYNGESKLWNPYQDENRNGMPDWIEQSPESVRGYLTHAYRLGLADQQRGFRRNEPYAHAEILQEADIRLAAVEVQEEPESGLPTDIDMPPRGKGPNVTI